MFVKARKDVRESLVQWKWDKTYVTVFLQTEGREGWSLTHTESKNITCNVFHQACLHFCFTHLINVIPWTFLFLFQHFLVLWGTVSIISCVRVYSCDPNTFWGGIKQQAGKDMIDFFDIRYLCTGYFLLSNRGTNRTVIERPRSESNCALCSSKNVYKRYEWNKW